MAYRSANFPGRPMNSTTSLFRAMSQTMHTPHHLFPVAQICHCRVDGAPHRRQGTRDIPRSVYGVRLISSILTQGVRVGASSGLVSIQHHNTRLLSNLQARTPVRVVQLMVVDNSQSIWQAPRWFLKEYSWHPSAPSLLAANSFQSCLYNSSLSGMVLELPQRSIRDINPACR